MDPECAASQVLPLAPLVWKQLVGEHVTWARDFTSVDEAEVRVLDQLATMDEQTFDAYCAGGGFKTWTTLLSNGRCVALTPGGDDVTLQYSDRHQYISLVQATRMNEFNSQVGCMLMQMASICKCALCVRLLRKAAVMNIASYTLFCVVSSCQL